MARSMIINFSPSSATSLYPTSVVGGGAGIIPLASPYPVIFPDIEINITLTSTDDLSAVNFTITGKDTFGNTISEVLAGPNNTTVTSAKQYNSIVSISSSGNYTNFSIGTGTTATFSWLSLNTMSPFPATTITATVYGTINYSINQTIDAIQSYQPVGPYYNFLYPKPVVLANNALATTNTSNVVTVTVPSTSALQTGNIVTIQNAAAVHNITAAQININAEITVTDATHFTYIAGGTANGTGAGGGANVIYYFPSFPTSYAINASLTGATASEIYTLTTPATAIQGIVNSSTSPATLTLTVLQQGLV